MPRGPSRRVRCGADGCPSAGSPEQAPVGVDVAADDADEVDALGDQPAGGGQALVGRQAAAQLVGDRQPQPDREVRPDGVAHGPHDGRGEAQPVVQRPAPVVAAVVGRRRQEAVEQVAVGLDLQTVEAALPHRRAADA